MPTPVTISCAVVPALASPGASATKSGMTTPEELENTESNALNAKINGGRSAVDAELTSHPVSSSIAPAFEATSIYITIPVTIRILLQGTLSRVVFGSAALKINNTLSHAKATTAICPPHLAR